MTGSVRPCVENPDAPVCYEQEFVRMGGTWLAPASLYQGSPVGTQVLFSLRLGFDTGQWNEVGRVDVSGRDVLSVSGTVKNEEQMDVPANAGGPAGFRLRLLGNRLEAWHEAATLNGQPMVVEIRYIRHGTGP